MEKNMKSDNKIKWLDKGKSSPEFNKTIAKAKSLCIQIRDISKCTMFRFATYLSAINSKNTSFKVEVWINNYVSETKIAINKIVELAKEIVITTSMIGNSGYELTWFQNAICDYINESLAFPIIRQGEEVLSRKVKDLRYRYRKERQMHICASYFNYLLPVFESTTSFIVCNVFKPMSADNIKIRECIDNDYITESTLIVDTISVDPKDPDLSESSEYVKNHRMTHFSRIEIGLTDINMHFDTCDETHLWDHLGENYDSMDDDYDDYDDKIIAMEWILLEDLWDATYSRLLMIDDIINDNGFSEETDSSFNKLPNKKQRRIVADFFSHLNAVKIAIQNCVSSNKNIYHNVRDRMDIKLERDADPDRILSHTKETAEKLYQFDIINIVYLLLRTILSEDLNFLNFKDDYDISPIKLNTVETIIDDIINGEDHSWFVNVDSREITNIDRYKFLWKKINEVKDKLTIAFNLAKLCDDIYLIDRFGNK